MSSSASPDEIRSAYRRLVKEYHPDHFTGGCEPFLEIQEAYSVLGDPHKRRQYEQSLRAFSSRMLRTTRRSREPEPLIPRERPVDVGEISPLRSFETFMPSFDEMFDWLWRNFSGLDWPKSDRVENLRRDHAVIIPLDRFGIRNLQLTMVFRLTDDWL